jgi:histidine kinase/DNA gyrase B/HSP90-like ATPase/HD domain-containing protein
MTGVLQLDSLKDTTLWKQLESGFSEPKEKDIAAELASKVKSACDLATERIKRFPYFHPQFTLHDERHFLRVAELMAMILSDDVKSLNPIEISLLLLAAYYHDQGMVPETLEWEQITESSEFRLSEERWEIEHPNVADIRRQLEDPRFDSREKDALSSKMQEHQEAHQTGYLRLTHGERAEQLVNQLLGTGGSLMASRVNLAPLLGKLCASHAGAAARLTNENGFRVDQAVGNVTVNLRFLALVLRLADILDFDRDRAPEPLLKTINLSSPVSLVEWEKHRSVLGWEISDKRIRFTMTCEHPAYQKAAYEFMDAIDHELREAHRVASEFPRDTPTHYRLQLPHQVERDRIEPRNNAYRYADLEFTLSRDEIVKLLMTEKLYNDNALFVRELIQNSLDALRHRVAIHGKGQPDWEEGNIVLEHFVDATGDQVVRCRDNGIGMDEMLVRNFLTNAGRSYYRSPEFAQQRVVFRENDVDFDPCSQFGIGFMSCFMFGDRIRITTRRDYGPGRNYGDPLEIEINGLGGLLVIRDGAVDQPVGTIVEITGPRKPSFLDEWTDEVRLCAVVEGYALSTEFPIAAKTLIEEIREEVRIPTATAVRRTVVEKAGIERSRIIEYQLKDTDQRLGGAIRIGLLFGVPTTGNKEAQWDAQQTAMGSKVFLNRDGKKEEYHRPTHESATCMDGILICGEPGRRDDRAAAMKLGWQGSPLDLGDPFVVDIRGDLKPLITPSRQPPGRSGRWNAEPTWAKVGNLLRQAHAAAWEPVLEYVEKGLTHVDFWCLSLLHGIPVHLMARDSLWERLYVPVLTNSKDTCDWKAFSEIGRVEPISFGEENHRKRAFRIPGTGRIGFPESLSAWAPGGYEGAGSRLLRLLFRFVRVEAVSDEASFTIGCSSSTPVMEFELSDSPFDHVSCLEYLGSSKELLSLQSEFQTVNRYHPLVEFARTYENVDYRNRTELQRYCASVLRVLSNNDNLTSLAKGEVTKGRDYRRLGTIFQSIDWSRQNKVFAPPYKVWTRDSGIIEITPEELNRWADFPSGD